MLRLQICCIQGVTGFRRMHTRPVGIVPQNGIV